MENSVTFDPSLDYGATFRFPVTWSYLTAAPVSAQPVPAPLLTHLPSPLPAHQAPQSMRPAPAPVPVPAPTPPPAPVSIAVAPTKPAETLKPVPAPKPMAPRASTAPDAKWEMVIPKMARPAALGSASRPARAPRGIEQPATPPAPAEPAEIPTEISFYAGSEASFLPRRWKVLTLTVAAVVVAGVLAWVRPGGTSVTGSDAAPEAAGTWSRRTAYLVGAKDAREILVYSGGQDVKNYRMEFSWVPDTRGVGWIFRGTDSANYYAAKLRLVQAGATPSLSAEHFTVVKGVEGTHSRKVITLGQTRNDVLVRMDANGPAFTLYLQGSPADNWTDERFETGSLGFYAERGERPALQALRFTFFKKSGLQTVVTSLQ